MDKNRLEAFSDGIMAIVITIMVLGLSVRQDPTWNSYWEAYPQFLSYALSFVFVGLYWSSHHHLLHKAKTVNNRILWANMLGLFWISLVPFAAGSMGQNHFRSITVTVYAVILTLCVVSYLILVRQLCCLHGTDSEFSQSFRGRFKSYATIVLNLGAATISILGRPKIAFLVLTLTALSWFVPNHRPTLQHRTPEKRSA